MNDGVTITHNDLDITIQEMKEEMPNVERSMLYRGAHIIRERAQEQFIRVLPAATKQSQKYNDTLVDAVKVGRLNGGTITIHTLGSREKGSGTYRARFFEGGTRDRYQKKINGVPLKEKKFIGKISPLRYFSTAVQTSQDEAFNAMQNILDNYINKKNNG